MRMNDIRLPGLSGTAYCTPKGWVWKWWRKLLAFVPVCSGHVTKDCRRIVSGRTGQRIRLRGAAENSNAVASANQCRGQSAYMCL
jgi:hypothetical protein